MFELLLLLVFLGSFVLFGVTFLATLLAFAFSFLLMLMMGMIGVLFKLLPWIIVIALGVYWYRQRRSM